MVQLFGFTLGEKKKQEEEEKVSSFISKDQEDGSIEVAPGGVYGTYVDLQGTAKTESDLVTKYREMSLQAECDSAIQDIVNEAIVNEDDDYPVEILLDNVEGLNDSIKKKITDEFYYMMKLLRFKSNAYEIFRKWYVDGRLYYHIMVDENQPKQGVLELRNIDPRRIKKIREPIKKKDPTTGITLYVGANEYYLYNQQGIGSKQNAGSSTQGTKIAVDSVCYVHSGLMDPHNKFVYSHLNKAIKPLNDLRMLENAVVIYRLSRAPERRIFYIDVGNLPKAKAEQYVRDMMTRYKNKMVYDAETGQVRDNRRNMTMMEDFWFPRREGGRGTQVETLQGGSNLGEMEDVEYFRRNLYRSLNVPVSRLETDGTFNLGRSSEITRDEIKFAKFVNRLRIRFSMLFEDLLEIQLSLKGVMTREEWNEIKEDVYFNFKKDNHFTELKEGEIMRERLALLADVDQYAGKYFSEDYIRRKILRFTEEEIKEMDKEIKKEGSDEDFEDRAMAIRPAPKSRPVDPGAIAEPEPVEEPEPAPAPKAKANSEPKSTEA